MIKKLMRGLVISTLAFTFFLNPIIPSTSVSTADTTPDSWDWNGVIGTGQSLSVGACATPAITTTQPYNNLKLSLGSLKVPPFDPTSSALSVTPLVEPIRTYATTYPGPYPGNIYGETPHSAMGNQITYLSKTNLGTDYLTAHTVVGESGQGMSALCKGATDTGSIGRAYAASLFEVSAFTRLAKEAGKTYGVGAIILTHGETDCGSSTYKSELYQLWSDYNTDIKSLTGQTRSIPLLVSQQHSCPSSWTAVSTQVQWQAGIDYPGKIVCAGPNYQYPYYSDGIHHNASGYRQLGEKYGQVYYQRQVLGNDWQPLHPISTSQNGNVITVNFHVPVLPLVWDTTLGEPNQSSLTEWKNGKGFEVSASGKRITINSVVISGSSVIITCASQLPASGITVGYAFTGGAKRLNGTFRWGLLRDSDPFTGSATNVANPNFCVAFQLAVPYNATATPSPTSTATATPTATATATSIPTPTPTATSTPSNSYTVTYTQNDWGNGATVNITISNNGTSAINGWTLTWKFPGNQKISNLWNGTYTQSGATVTVTNLSYNSAISGGGTVSFGFNLSYSGSNTKPTYFTLNGTNCQIK